MPVVGPPIRQIEFIREVNTIDSIVAASNRFINECSLDEKNVSQSLIDVKHSIHNIEI